MGSSALGVWKELGICLKRDPQNPLAVKNSFKVDDMITRVIADGEHLFKNVRCNFYNLWTKYKFNPKISESVFEKYKDQYGLTSREISWQHIEKLFEYQSNLEFKLAPRLTKSCFELQSNYSKICLC